MLLYGDETFALTKNLSSRVVRIRQQGSQINAQHPLAGIYL